MAWYKWAILQRWGMLNWNNVRLVIPKGVQVCTGGGDAWETVLFFCDKEENVNKDYFGTLDEPHFEGEGYNYKAAYYAGEWEYVDGIPTPLN